MNIGSKVVFEDETYTVVYLYDNGYCELKSEKEQFKILLVKQSDVIPAP